MNFNLPDNLEKKQVFRQIFETLKKEKFTIIKQDETLPWWGFFVIEESQANAFTAQFFPNLA
mgnify:CR=1 FL=1